MTTIAYLIEDLQSERLFNISFEHLVALCDAALPLTEDTDQLEYESIGLLALQYLLEAPTTSSDIKGKIKAGLAKAGSGLSAIVGKIGQKISASAKRAQFKLGSIETKHRLGSAALQAPAGAYQRGKPAVIPKLIAKQEPGKMFQGNREKTANQRVPQPAVKQSKENPDLLRNVTVHGITMHTQPKRGSVLGADLSSTGQSKTMRRPAATVMRSPRPR